MIGTAGQMPRQSDTTQSNKATKLKRQGDKIN